MTKEITEIEALRSRIISLEELLGAKFIAREGSRDYDEHFIDLESRWLPLPQFKRLFVWARNLKAEKVLPFDPSEFN